MIFTLGLIVTLIGAAVMEFFGSSSRRNERVEPGDTFASWLLILGVFMMLASVLLFIWRNLP